MQDEPFAYFLTWTCYGTHLPGANSGWTKWHKGDRLPEPQLEDWCRDRMTESAVTLTSLQRRIVEQVIRDHCKRRSWTLHAANCRSNHCHVVVTATGYAGDQVRNQFKSWTTRGLKEDELLQRSPPKRLRERWWTRQGSVRHLFDEQSLEAAVIYTLDSQDQGGSKARI